MTMKPKRSTVYHQPGRFAGWPANYGLWAWGQEVVSIFVVGWVGPLHGIHARDMTRPFEPVQMRSYDGGRTWSQESFTASIPGGGTTLSGDEHVVDDLKVGPRLTAADFGPVDLPIDFADPETIVLCARTDLASGSWSWFYASRDRARSWSGPHLLPDFGLAGLSARTDIVPIDADSALMMLTAPKANGDEGRVFCAHLSRGGRTFERRGWIGDEPEGWCIMPSSVRLGDGSILTALRCAGPRPPHQWTHWIDLHRSADNGRTWTLDQTVVTDTGAGGNPPALVALPDQRLVLTYGYRDQPTGLRAVTSTDRGHTWSDPITLTDDVAMGDMGYPRSVVLDDGTLLTVFYANQGEETDRSIEATRWSPDPDLRRR